MSSTAEETFAGKPKIGSPVTVSLGDSMPDIGDELASVFEESYKAAGLTLAKNRTVGVVTPNAKANAEAYARARAGDAITDIDATTHNAVQRVIGNALRDSLSQQETADKLSGLFGDARAQTIARTEAQTAYNAGTISALKDAGEEYAVVNDPCECGEEVCDVDGEIWTLEECEQQLLGHPNCGRDFRPLTEDELADVKEEEAADEAEGFAFLEARLALLEARQAFYSEDQPREPAGVPEGGQWVEYPDGGSVGSSPIADKKAEDFILAQRINLVENGFTHQAVNRMFNAVQDYRDKGYASMNAALRNGKVTAKADAMMRALKVLPTLKTGTLWRGTSMPVATIEKMERSGSFTTKQFFSVSESKSVADGFRDHADGKRRDVTFEIVGHRSAVSINAWGPRWVRREREAVFPPGTRFKVVGFTRNKYSGDVHVKVREVKR